MRDGESIMKMTPEEAIEVYESSGVSIAMMIAKDSVFEDPRPDHEKALKAGTDAVDSFRDFILSHSRCNNEEHTESMFHYAACTMLWMDRVHLHIDNKGRDGFPEGPVSFINDVTAYSLLTNQDWGKACEELLKQGGEA